MGKFVGMITAQRMSDLNPVFLLACSAAALSPAAATAAGNDRRPDIVLLIADDWGFPHASVYGDKTVKTPAFDYVISRGVLFTNAYCAAPSSAPSRAAILTGRYPHELGEAGNLQARFPVGLQVYPDVLERHGYLTALEGKGWAPGDFKYYGRTDNPAGKPCEGIAEVIRKAPKEQPLCLWFGSRHPHRPYEVGIGKQNGIDPDKIEVSPNLPDADAVRGDVADYYYNIQRFDSECLQIIDALREAGRLENTLLVMTSDNGYPFPRAKANLYNEGSHIPMAVMWGGHVPKPFAFDGFVNLLELAATFYDAAGVTPPEPIRGSSILPVLTGKQKASARGEVFLERERHANVRAGNVGYPSRAIKTADYIYIRNLRSERWPVGDPDYASRLAPYGDCDNGPAKSFLVGHRNEYPVLFELAFGMRPAEELYDLRKDPGQHHNVAADPAYAAALKKLRGQLSAWMRSTNDIRATQPQTDIFDTYYYTGAI